MWQDAQAALFAMAGIRKSEPSTTYSKEASNLPGSESRWEFTNSMCTPTSSPISENKTTVPSNIDIESSSVASISSAAIPEGIQSINERIETPQSIEDILQIRDKPRSGSEMSVSSLISNSNSLTNDGINEDVSANAELVSETGKKKSKKNKKKKPSSTSNAIEDKNEIKEQVLRSILIKNGNNKKRKNAADRHITWGRVELVEFSRAIGISSVPNRGLYPLGLGQPLDQPQWSQSLSVDEHFLQQQERLRQRALSLNPRPSSPVASPTRRKSHETLTTRSAPVSTAAAKHSKKPPPRPEHPPTLFESRQFDFSPLTNPLFHPLSESARIALLSHSPQDALKEVNRDVKAIQASRTNFSCSCKPVKIDKLSVARMRSELLLLHPAKEPASPDSPAGHSPPPPDLSPADWVAGLGKPELVQQLRQALKTCVLCAASNCECFQQGISCSSMGCPCQRRTAKAEQPHSSQSCANPFGHPVFNPDEVRAYRQRVLVKQRAGSV